ncbi:hypothetical protein ACFRAR_04300 [Kitasatospora sp. NPDC056651]|uniref:hypothetical protein n=1 Tax=Kitasatospora sp. NPDC056651 TaxID=3345892 RepID=UPI0036BF9BFA
MFLFDIKQSPDPVTITAKLTGVSATKVTGKITDIPPLKLTLDPIGGGVPIYGSIASFIALCAPVFTGKLNDWIKANVVDQEHSFDLGKGLGFSFTVEGQDIHATAKGDLELSDFNGALLAAGDIDIT